MAAPICAVLALLSAVAIADRITSISAIVTTLSVLATVGLLVVARRAGLTYADLGLGRHTLRRGALYALGCAAVIAVVYALLVALPATREAFADDRYHYPLGRAVVVALVTVPLSTVLLEEVAFRGVLWALVRRARGAGSATVVSSALFGLWHLLSASSFARANELASDVPTGVVVGGTIVLTALAGGVLCELRRRTGSLLPSIAVHWAVNGLGIVSAAIVLGSE